jgi:hypothetical protein
MFNINNKSIGFAAPSLEGGMGWVSFDWGKLLKVLIAVLTALAGAIGVASCTA